MSQLTPNAAMASWGAQLLAAAILGQTLYFKLSGSAESRFIFARLGAEPAGRLLTAGLEAVIVVLLLVPRTAALGGLLAAGCMAGAIAAHMSRIGIEVLGDGGLLFGLAVTTACCGLLVAWLRRRDLGLRRAGGR